MRAFELYDASRRGHKAVAVLLCEKTRDDETGYRMRVHISPETAPADLPFMLALFAERGVLEVPDEWARRWVAERIPPQGRQNLGEILRANGLDAYDEVALLAASQGRSSQDDFLLREVEGRSTEYAFVTLEEEPVRRRGWCETIGLEIAERRKAAGMTQRELAEKTGIDQAAISRIENGRANPTIDTLEALAEGVGSSLLIKVV